MNAKLRRLIDRINTADGLTRTVCYNLCNADLAEGFTIGAACAANKQLQDRSQLEHALLTLADSKLFQVDKRKPLETRTFLWAIEPQVIMNACFTTPPEKPDNVVEVKERMSTPEALRTLSDRLLNAASELSAIADFEQSVDAGLLVPAEEHQQRCAELEKELHQERNTGAQLRQRLEDMTTYARARESERDALQRKHDAHRRRIAGMRDLLGIDDEENAANG